MHLGLQHENLHLRPGPAGMGAARGGAARVGARVGGRGAGAVALECSMIFRTALVVRVVSPLLEIF